MTNIPIPRSSDATVVRFFERLQAECGFQVAQFRYIGNNHDQPLNGDIKKQFGSLDGFSILFCAGALPQLVRVEFARAEQGSGAFDRITITPGQQPLPLATAVKIDNLINESFRSTVAGVSALYGDTSPLKEVIESHEQIALQIEQGLGQVTRSFGQTLDDLGKKYASQRVALEKEYETLREKNNAEAEALKSKLNSEYEEKSSALAEREKYLNDRDNTHVRRAIREEMKRKLQEHAKEFSLTKSTKQLRLPIHLIVVVSLLALAAYISFLSYKIDPANSASWVFLIKPALLTVAALGILTWYIRWMNRWFEQHADAEFYLKQFDLDIDRASLVVETAMEWKASQQADIPSSLLESLTRNLFVRAERQDSNEMHPADYLASAILGNASRARLKFGNAELDYSKGALKKAANAVDAD